MSKTDKQDAFRIIPIHVNDHKLLGFSWRGSYYYDKCLPVGASSSCQIFESLSTSLQWIMCSKFQASGMSHLLDDFFFIGPGDSPICLKALEKFLTICEEAGIPIKHVKTQQPSTLITIYGSTASHISAISYVHKVMNIFDPTQAFVARKILKGCQFLGSYKDSRLPITQEILRIILHALNHTVPLHFHRCLLRALFLLAFHAFLRLGELTTKSKVDANRVLQRCDIHFEYKGASLHGMQIVMREYKTNKNHSPIIISLQAIQCSPFCPVLAPFEYLQLSKHTSGPLFQTVDAQPISYAFVSTQLKSAIKFVGLDPLLFKRHSFGIGAATYAASLGYSEQLIKKLGRWN